VKAPKRRKNGTDALNGSWSQQSSHLPGSISSTLLDAVRGGRPEAWARFVSLYGPVVYRWCRHAGLPPQDAPDLVQEVFAAVARGVAGFRRERPSDSFRAWLATVTRNKVRDYFRKRRSLPAAAAGGTDAQEQLMQVPDPLQTEQIDESADDDARIISNRALELVRLEFEPRTWEAFWLTAVEGRSATEVADQLGMSTMAVYQAKSRVLRRLRRELDELID